MPTMRALFALAVLLAAYPVHAKDTDKSLFVQAAERTDEADPRALNDALERLISEEPLFWQVELPACPLRSTWARSLTPSEAQEKLVAAPDKGAVIANLSSRADILALLANPKVLAEVLPTRVKLVARIAVAALVDGTPSPLLFKLIARADCVKKTADELCRLPFSAGLRFLADIALNRHPINSAAQDALYAYQPDIQNPRLTKLLRSDQVTALAITADRHPNPKARAFCARLLLHANDRESVRETLSAWRSASTVHLQSWGQLGKHAETAITDARVPLNDRLAMLEGWLLWDWVRAESDPFEAERYAAEFRRVLETAPPWFYAHAVRFLHNHSHVFVTTLAIRKRPVPSLVGILNDLDAGRASDPEGLTAFGLRMAQKIRNEIAQEDASPRKLRLRGQPAPELPPIARVARVLAGVERDDKLLRQLSDDLDPGSALRYSDERQAAAFRKAIPDSLRAPLIERVRTPGDPELANWAAVLLGRRGTDEDNEALFRNGGHRAVLEIKTPRTLAAALQFVATGRAPNEERASIFVGIHVYFGDEDNEEIDPALRATVVSWVKERLPNLNRDLREEIQSMLD